MIKTRKLSADKIIFFIAAAIVLIYAIYWGMTNVASIDSTGVWYFSFATYATLIVGALAVIAAAYFGFWKQWPVEKVYPVVALLLGTIFILVMPAYSKPDENAHFGNAYDLSNKIMGVEEASEGMVYRRVCDTVYTTNYFYNGLYEGFGSLFVDDADTTLVEVVDQGYSAEGVVVLLYIVPAIGITVARILQLNFPMTYFLAAFFSLCWFVFLMTYALKKMPVAKRTLLILLLMPITLQECTSVAKDNVLIASAFLFVVLTMRFMQEKEEHVKPTKVEMILYLYSGIITATTKSFLYSVLIAWAILLFMNKGWFKGKRKWAWITVIAVGVIGVLAVVFLKWDVIYELLTQPFYQDQLDIYTRSVWDMISHPGNTYQIIRITLIQFQIMFTSQLTGNYAGWLEIFNEYEFRYVYYILFFFSQVHQDSDEIRLSVRTRVVSNLASVAIVILATVAMFLVWTPTDAVLIEGIQGRYFIPAILPFALSWGYFSLPTIHVNLDKYYTVILSALGVMQALWILQYNIAVY